MWVHAYCSVWIIIHSSPLGIALGSQCNLIPWIIRSLQTAFSIFCFLVCSTRTPYTRVKHFKLLCLRQWHWYLSFKWCSTATSRHDGIGGVSFHSLLQFDVWNRIFHLVAIIIPLSLVAVFASSEFKQWKANAIMYKILRFIVLVIDDKSVNVGMQSPNKLVLNEIFHLSWDERILFTVHAHTCDRFSMSPSVNHRVPFMVAFDSVFQSKLFIN